MVELLSTLNSPAVPDQDCQFGERDFLQILLLVFFYFPFTSFSFLSNLASMHLVTRCGDILFWVDNRVFRLEALHSSWPNGGYNFLG